MLTPVEDKISDTNYYAYFLPAMGEFELCMLFLWTKNAKLSNPASNIIDEDTNLLQPHIISFFYHHRTSLLLGAFYLK